MRFNSAVELNEGGNLVTRHASENLSNSITRSNTYAEVFTIEDNTGVIQ